MQRWQVHIGDRGCAAQFASPLWSQPRIQMAGATMPMLGLTARRQTEPFLSSLMCLLLRHPPIPSLPVDAFAMETTQYIGGRRNRKEVPGAGGLVPLISLRIFAPFC